MKEKTVMKKLMSMILALMMALSLVACGDKGGSGDNGDNGEAVDDNQSANVAKFTNTYVAVSALPLTGGMTDRQWLFVGGAVGGLAVLLIGAAGVWNGKKRLV